MRIALITLMLLASVGCASIVKEKVKYQPAENVETVQTTRTILLVFESGQGHIIDANTTWQYVGNISNKNLPEGKVYKPVNDVLSIEGTQRYEAYLVVANGKIIGFYLPASSNFSPLRKQVEFP